MTGSVLGVLPPGALHVMTLNVRRPVGALAWPPRDRWSRRRGLLAALLATERPTMLGCQELVPAQATVIATALGPAYRRIGHGRTLSPRSEGCPIFFDARRLELLEWHQTALSDRPDEPGSRTWGNAFPRVLVTGSFRERTTGALFAMVNTHLDPLSARSRVRSAYRIRETVRAAGVPAIVTGDVNEDVGGATAGALFEDDDLADAWTLADAHRSPAWGTLARYRSPRSGPRIDWIAVTPGVRVHAAAIGGADRAFDAASDHLPVHAAVSIGRAAA